MDKKEHNKESWMPHKHRRVNINTKFDKQHLKQTISEQQTY